MQDLTPDPQPAQNSRNTVLLTRRRMLYAGSGGLLLLALWSGGIYELARHPSGNASARNIAAPIAAPAPAGTDDFVPPPESSIPDGPDGAAIRRGMALFTEPRAHVPQYVGNDMACAHCHQDAGRKPFAAPMWAAWVAYPKYRSKNDKINTMEERIRDCFVYSMNAGASASGGPPPWGSPVYADMMAYFRWLATGAPVGQDMKGAGFLKLSVPANGYDRERGRHIYEEHCALCHGGDGNGTRGEQGEILFPPLWGARSYNWGAGMARVDRAAQFIVHNMPKGSEGSLTEQQAWDVAAWIDSQERPKDPRQTGSVEEAARRYHDKEESFYGKVADGHLLGTGL